MPSGEPLDCADLARRQLRYAGGLITFDENCRVVISPRLRSKSANDFHRATLLEIEGAPLILPTRFPPDQTALHHHRQHIFLTN